MVGARLRPLNEAMDGCRHRTMPHSTDCRRRFVLPRVLLATLVVIGFACGDGGTAHGHQLPVDDQSHPPVREPLPEISVGEAYSLVEVLALQRDNEAANRPLVTDATSGATLLSVQDLNASTAMGARVFVGRRVDDSWGREAGYLGVYGMTAAQTLGGDGNLALAGPLESQSLPFTDGNRVRATYVSTINSAEFNAFRSRCEGGDCIDWLCGFRYLNVAEQAGLAFTCCEDSGVGPFHSSYNVQSSNNLIGGQLGGRARRTWENWAVEGWAKTGLFANVANQSQAPIIDPTGSGTVVRDARSASGTETAFVADLNASLIYRLNDVWGIRAGYNLIWISGIALAPNQWDFSTATAGGTTLTGGDSMFLSGANLGLEARW